MTQNVTRMSDDNINCTCPKNVSRTRRFVSKFGNVCPKCNNKILAKELPASVHKKRLSKSKKLFSRKAPAHWPQIFSPSGSKRKLPATPRHNPPVRELPRIPRPNDSWPYPNTTEVQINSNVESPETDNIEIRPLPDVAADQINSNTEQPASDNTENQPENQGHYHQLQENNIVNNETIHTGDNQSIDNISEHTTISNRLDQASHHSSPASRSLSGSDVYINPSTESVSG